MKIKRVDPKFKPVVIEMTFESIEEVQAIWHLSNTSTSSARKIASSTVEFPDGKLFDNVKSELWQQMDKIINP